jgi:hypothetical protein
MYDKFVWFWYILSYAIICFGAHTIVRLAINKLWDVTINDLLRRSSESVQKSLKEPTRPNSEVAFWYGVVERAIFMSCFIIKKPEGIAVWLAFKSVVRWKISEDPDPRHISGSSIYMIGTAMNIGLGFLGAVIALRSFSFIIPY